MTDLIQGHEEIHIYVDHLIDEPEELEVEDIEPLEVLQPGEEPSVEPLGAEVRNDQALEVVNPEVVKADDPGGLSELYTRLMGTGRCRSPHCQGRT